MSKKAIEITMAVRDALDQPIIGEGGFQDLLRELSGQVEDSVLRVTDEQIARIHRYAESYGEGGYQERLRTIRDAIVAA